LIEGSLSKKSNSKEKLQISTEVQEFILSLARKFIEIKASEINDSIENALGDISKFVNSDRCYIYLFEDSQQRLTLSHKSYRSGIKEKIAQHDQVNGEDFKWFIKPLLENQAIKIVSVTDLPDKASTLKAIMEVENTQSMIAQPINVNGAVSGFLGLDQVDSEVSFSEEISGLLKLSGDIFASAIHRYDHIAQSMRMEEKYSHLFTEIEDIVFISNPEGRFIDINPAGAKMFGYSSVKEVMDLDIQKAFYVNPKDREKYKNEMQTKGRVKDYELIIKNKKGEDVYVSETSSAVKDENGVVIAYQGILRDVTYQRQLEHRLFQAKKMESIGMLAGGIAHDFNNILTTIRGYADLMMMNLKSTDPLFNDVDSIIKGVKRAEDLIRQLLAFSRRQMIEPKVIDINKVISDLHTMLNRLISDDIAFDLKLREGLAYIKADPIQIQQILVNLVANANHAINKQADKAIGKKIRISTNEIQITKEETAQYPGSQEGDYIEIEISDTGIGMNEETKQSIFEPFFSTKKEGEGTGLGLATVYGIVKQNKSFIYIDSHKGDGTTFKIFWPFAEVQKRDETRIDTQIQIEKRSETILFVEDDADVRTLACQALTTFGYSVIEASNGKEALDLVNKEYLIDKIDLVISDIVMPEMNGEELAEHLRDLKSDINILLCSGFTDSRVATREGGDRGGNHFLPKPYTIKNLEKMIRSILNESSE
jgi:PAS domain S-box-containing protein